MTDYLIQQFLDDAGITLEKEDFGNYADFVRFYFKELVKLGTFLSDVPFASLTPRAKNLVFRSGYNLWKKAQYEQSLV